MHRTQDAGYRSLELFEGSWVLLVRSLRSPCEVCSVSGESISLLITWEVIWDFKAILVISNYCLGGFSNASAFKNHANGFRWPHPHLLERCLDLFYLLLYL